MEVIKIENLSKRYASNIILENISFGIEKGSFTALLGKNGSGKSTLLNVLMGQILLDKGDVHILGHSIKKDPAFLKNQIGYVSESINFDYPTTVIEFFKSLTKLYSSFDLDLVQKIAADVKIDLDRRFQAYSRGQKMQIVLMAALAHKPEILFVDEITSVLDAFSRNYFVSLLKKFTQDGGTVLLTTNIVSEVQDYCTDVIILSDKAIKIHSKVADVSKGFWKVRRPAGESVTVNDDMFWIGLNSDGSHSFISNSPIEGVPDRRAVTLEEVYIYFSQKSYHD